MSLEKEKVPYSETDIRKLSLDIVRSSQDLLTLDVPKIERELVPKLLKFKNSQEKDTSKNPFARNELTFRDELGLAVFFGTVNFCFTEPTSKHRYTYISMLGNTYHGSQGLYVAMAELSKTGLSWGSLAQVGEITQESWDNNMQLGDNNPFYLGQERLRKVTGFAQTLQKQGFSDVGEWLASTHHNAVKILKSLRASGYFDDQFQKRSQVTVKAFDDIIRRRGGFEIANMNTLTCMADYKIPQVLYNTGIVKLAPELEEYLKSQRPLKPESRPELALRSSAIVVGEYLATLLYSTEAEVDTLLWGLSQEMNKNGELKIPHMLIPTDKY